MYTRMKTVKIKVECVQRKKFKTEFNVDTNEHGFFDIANGFCPECFYLLDKIVDGSIREV